MRNTKQNISVPSYDDCPFCDIRVERTQAVERSIFLNTFNVVIVGQAGRLQYEALLFALSFRATNPTFKANSTSRNLLRTIVGTLIHGFLMAHYAICCTSKALYFLPFENKAFGEYYPNANKIECLTALPKDEPFVFFDTDTLITGDIASVPFDFDRPSASLNVTGTWPEIELYGPGYTEIWHSIYDLFWGRFHSQLDLSQPDEYWRRYSYFNAGFFYYKCPHAFGKRYLEFATTIRDTPPKAIECQTLYPWLDQIALPLVLQSFGSGRDALPQGCLDGKISTHYRYLALFFATAPDEKIEFLMSLVGDNKVKKILKDYEPFKKFIFQNAGKSARKLFDQTALPASERMIRKRLKNQAVVSVIDDATR